MKPGGMIRYFIWDLSGLGRDDHVLKLLRLKSYGKNCRGNLRKNGKEGIVT